MMIYFCIILAMSFMNGGMWVLPCLCMYASLDEPKRSSAGNRRQRKFFQQGRDRRVTTQSKTEKKELETQPTDIKNANLFIIPSNMYSTTKCNGGQVGFVAKRYPFDSSINKKYVTHNIALKNIPQDSK